MPFSCRKQLEEEHFGQADPYGAELESTPLARDSVGVQHRQQFRARVPTGSVGRQITQASSAQIVNAPGRSPMLM